MSLRKFAGVAALVALAFSIGCDETTKPPPPPPAPQITHGIYYTRTFSSVDTLNGLMDNDVYAILAASDGKAWLGSAEGVAVYPTLDTTVRLDGFDNSNGLPNPKVRALAEYDGKIYVGTWGGGVGVYDMTAQTWSSIPVTQDGLRNEFVGHIAVVADSIYFSTNDGVSIWNTTRDSWQHVKMRTQIQGGPNAGTWRSDGILEPFVSLVTVATTERGVEEWYGGRVEFTIPPNDAPLHGIAVRRSGIADYVYYTLSNSGLSEANVNDIYYDEDTDLFWVAYGTKGISVVDVGASTWTHITTAHGLPSDIVYAIVKLDGVFWAATQRGIARQTSSGWRSYGLSGGLKADIVRLVYTDDGVKLWLAYADAGAGRVLPNTAQ